MLIFSNVALFEKIYDAAVKCYPELKSGIIIIDLNGTDNLSIFEGTGDDAGKYKLSLKMEEDYVENIKSIALGFAMILCHNKYGQMNSKNMTEEQQATLVEMTRNILEEVLNVPSHGEMSYETVYGGKIND